MSARLTASSSLSGYPKEWLLDVPQINAGGGENVCFPPPGSYLNLEIGYTYDFNMHVDPNNTVAESSENNNFGHVSLVY